MPKCVRIYYYRLLKLLTQMNQFLSANIKGGRNGDRPVKIKKTAGEDEIRSKILKALNSKGILWLLKCIKLRRSLAKHQEINYPNV